MTDITELAQREKFEAWVMTHICISKSTLEGLRTAEGYRNSTLSGTDYNLLWSLYQSATAELVEALEKAQTKIIVLQQKYEIDPRTHEIIDLEERVAELESEVEKWKQEAETWEQVAEKQLATAIALESRAAMLERQLVDHVDEESLITIKAAPTLGSLPKTGEVQNTNYPAIPDGYVMVPKEATLEMIKSGASAASNGMLIPGIYKAMLAAADCSTPMICRKMDSGKRSDAGNWRYRAYRNGRGS